MARRFCWALLAVVAMTATASAAKVRTTNFIVETARQDDAEEFARLAEYYRKQKALDWLGKEMPQWREPCRLRVHVTKNAARQALNFSFDHHLLKQQMNIESKRHWSNGAVLPHEVTHT